MVTSVEDICLYYGDVCLRATARLWIERQATAQAVLGVALQGKAAASAVASAGCERYKYDMTSYSTTHPDSAGHRLAGTFFPAPPVSYAQLTCALIDAVKPIGARSKKRYLN
jgi:hypothetical protein